MKKITNLTRTPIDLAAGVIVPALASIEAEVNERVSLLEKVKAVSIEDIAPEPAKRGRPAKTVEVVEPASTEE